MFNWHEPTPLSRMLAIVLFVGIIPTLSFYIGTKYQETRATPTAMRVYDIPRLSAFSQAQLGAASATDGNATSTPEDEPVR